MLRLLVLSLVFITGVNAQLLVENFSYGGLDSDDIVAVSGSSWVRHEGVLTPAGPGYKASGLSYAGYASSGIDGALSFTATSTGVSNDGDANRTFTAQTAGVVYASFLLNLSVAPTTTSGFFFHLGPNPMGSTSASYKGRLYAVTNGGSGFYLGLSKHTETAKWDSTTVLNTGQTYLFVLKYAIIGSVGTDDEVTLYVYDTNVPSSEPSSPLVTLGPTAGGNDLTNVGAVCVRQGTNSPTGKIDGIRVAASWSDAPLPVELAAFTAAAGLRGATLTWKTMSEVDNAGFEVERREIAKGELRSANYQKVGFVAGAGTSTTEQAYSFTDAPAPGRYAYRLNQIDRNGGSTYSGEVEVVVGLAPKSLTLSAYPNPFNPATTIDFTLQDDGAATLRVFNLLGQEVATLFTGAATAGRLYQVPFDASRLTSGIYVARLDAGDKVAMTRLTVIK